MEVASDELVREWRALTFYQMGGVLHDLIMEMPPSTILNIHMAAMRKQH